ncbi:MAG: ATP12 family protein, partial [Henriciella sp.]
MNTKTSAKRFYDSASVETSENVDRWLVCLDGRAISTPLKHRLELPTRALAQAIADEWQSQTDVIDLPALTLTRLANFAMDRTPVARAEMIAEISR